MGFPIASDFEIQKHQPTHLPQRSPVQPPNMYLSWATVPFWGGSAYTLENSGNIIKMDRHRYIRVAFHGFTKLESDERKRVYLDGEQVCLSTFNSRMPQLTDLELLFIRHEVSGIRKSYRYSRGPDIARVCDRRVKYRYNGTTRYTDKS